MTIDPTAEAFDRLEAFAATLQDPAPKAALLQLLSLRRAGNISNSAGVAIGDNIRLVVNQLTLPADTASALLEIRHALGRELGLDPDRYRLPTLLAEKTRDFVGRAYVFEAIETFLASEPNGYFVLVGEPGIGKSAFLGQYVGQTGCLAHFNVRAQGISTARQFLESVCAQIIIDASLSYPSLPSHVTEDGAFLARLLQEASGRLSPGQRLVIAVDALDEVDWASHPPGANVLFLPKSLPPGVYFILTRRPMELPLSVDAPLRELDLMAYPAENRADVAAYLEKQATRPGVQAWLQTQTLDGQPLSAADFVSWLADRSEANFMYLRYVLPEIESGAYRDRDLRGLPRGLKAYYEEHWDRMGMRATPAPELKITIVYILCEVDRPVSLRMLLDILAHNRYDARPLQLQAVLDEWAQFLHAQPAPEGTRYSVYHASFRDFLYRKDIVQAAGITLRDINALISSFLWDTLFDGGGA